jgi:hypothetical protein
VIANQIVVGRNKPCRRRARPSSMCHSGYRPAGAPDMKPNAFTVLQKINTGKRSPAARIPGFSYRPRLSSCQSASAVSILPIPTYLLKAGWLEEIQDSTSRTNRTTVLTRSSASVSLIMIGLSYEKLFRLPRARSKYNAIVTKAASEA